jgi:hypothetical protein
MQDIIISDKIWSYLCINKKNFIINIGLKAALNHIFL